MSEGKKTLTLHCEVKTWLTWDLAVKNSNVLKLSFKNLYAIKSSKLSIKVASVCYTAAPHVLQLKYLETSFHVQIRGLGALYFFKTFLKE